MELNWTMEVVLNLLSFLPYLISSMILLKQYLKHNDKILLLLVITWFSYGFFWLANGISYLFLSEQLFRLNKGFLAISALSLVIAYDFMSREEIEPIKFSIFSIISVGLLYFSFQSDAVSIIELAGEQTSLQNTGSNRTLITILALLVILVYLYYAVKIYIYASEMLKKYALLHLIGAIIFGPITLILFLIEIGLYVPGLTALVSSLGVLMSSIAFARSPQLVYTLPFTVSRLILVESDSGVTIFRYSWQKKTNLIPDELFSTVFESLNIFTDEAIDMGKIQSIKLENGVLIVRQAPKYNLSAVLVSSQPSKVLEANLKNFVRLFVDNYQSELKSQMSTLKLTSVYENADELVHRAFPYIPQN